MALLTDIPKFGFSTDFTLVGQSSQASTSSASSSAPGPAAGPANPTVPAGLDNKITEESLVHLLYTAVRNGCRHFDTAPHYGTQQVVGSVLQQCILNKEVTRSDLYLTAKVHAMQMISEESILGSFRTSLANLRVDYLDCILLQGPGTGKDNEGWTRGSEMMLEFAWRRLLDLKQTGKVRYIGACNLAFKQIWMLNRVARLDIVQNPYHLYSQDRELLDYCEEVDVHWEAMVTPLAASYVISGPGPLYKPRENWHLISEAERQILLDEDEKLNRAEACIARISEKYSLTRSQLMIQWIHKQPLSYIITSKTPEQLVDNLRATRTNVLSIDELIELDSLNPKGPATGYVPPRIRSTLNR